MGKKQTDLTKYRPTLASYNNLKEEDRIKIDSVIKDALKPDPFLRIHRTIIKPKYEDLWMLSWAEMIQLKEWITDNNFFEILSFFYSIKENQFNKLDLINCLCSYKWISNSLEEIQKIENQELSYEETVSDKQAGVDMLSQFGYYVSLDVLAGGDILKYDAIMQKPYAVIFRKLCLDNTKSIIQKRYMQNASRKV